LKIVKSEFSWSNSQGRREYTNVAYEKDGELCYGRIGYDRPNLYQMLDNLVKQELMTPEQAIQVMQTEMAKEVKQPQKSADYIAQVQRRARLLMR